MTELVYLVWKKDDYILQQRYILFLFRHFDNLLENEFHWNAVRVFAMICSFKTTNSNLITHHRLFNMYQETIYSLGSITNLIAENENGLDRRDLLLCALVAMGEMLKLCRSTKLEKYASLANRLSHDIDRVLQTLFKDMPDPKPQGFYQQLLHETNESQSSLTDEVTDNQGDDHIHLNSVACSIHDTAFRRQAKVAGSDSGGQGGYSSFAAHMRRRFHVLNGVSPITSVVDSSRTTSDRLRALACCLVQDLEHFSLARNLDLSKIIKIRCSNLKISASQFVKGFTEQQFAEESTCEADTVKKIRKLPKLEEEYREKCRTLKSRLLFPSQRRFALEQRRFESFSHEETVEMVRFYLEAIEELRSLTQTSIRDIDFVWRLRAKYDTIEQNSRPERRKCYFAISAIQRMIEQCHREEECMIHFLEMVSIA